MFRRTVLGLLLAACGGCAAASADRRPEPFDFGPVAARVTDTRGNTRLRAAGPFFESATSPCGGRLIALRPFYARVIDGREDRSATDFCWPVGSTKRIGDERSWRFLTAWGTDFDIEDPDSRRRLWVLPVFFRGVDKEGDGYLALFPLGGSIHEFLTRDRIAFALFPLWMRTELNEIRTTHVLWPIYARTEGKGIERLKVFPLYGRARHRESFEKGFVLWPFWTWSRYHYPRSSGFAYVLWPLWGRVHLTDQHSWMLLPPLVRVDRSERQRRAHAPWPLVQWAEGEIDKLYLWPLWGRKREGQVHSWFAVWPLVRFQGTERDGQEHSRFTVTPLVYTRTVREAEPEDGARGEVRERHRKVWPLLDRQAEGEARRTRLPALWPLPNPPPVERSWAPLWTLFDDTVTADDRDTELLWGLFSRRRRGRETEGRLFPFYSWRADPEEGRSWSILSGLLARECGPESARWRVLYWRKGRRGADPDDEAQQEGREP